MADGDRIDYDDAHLLVAAVRVLAHRAGRPPTVEEMADSIGLSREVAFHLVRRLAALGAVQLVETPFEARLLVADHTRLETLPRGEAAPPIASEFDTFRERNEEKQKEFDRLFEGGSVEKKKQERVSSLEKKFKQFRDSRRAWMASGDAEDSGPEEGPRPGGARDD